MLSSHLIFGIQSDSSPEDIFDKIYMLFMSRRKNPHVHPIVPARFHNHKYVNRINR